MKRLITKASVIVLGAALLTNTMTAMAAEPLLISEEKGAADVQHALEGIAEPWGLAKGTGSDIIVVSKGSSLIYKWTASGLTAIGGQAGIGYNDGLAADTSFDGPTYAAVDSKGIIYISDTENHVVRKIVDGRVYTFSGNGNVGNVDGTRDKATFAAPGGIVVDAGDNVYVADTLNHVIRKITPNGTVSTFAGLASEVGGYKDGSLAEAMFNEPMGLAFDDEGRLYVADSGNHLIRVIDGDKVSTFAGKPTEVDADTGYRIGGYVNGAAKHARFNRPRDVTYAGGVLYVADSLNHRIRAIKPNGIVISIAGQSTPGDAVGAAAEAQFNEPSALLYISGKLFVSDVESGSVKTIEAFSGALQAIVTDEDLLASAELLPVTEDVQGWLDGASIPFTDVKKPYRIQDRLYVPIRPLFEAWGADIEWKQETSEAVISKGEWSYTFKADQEGNIVLNHSTMYADFKLLEELGLFASLYDEEFNALIYVSMQ